MIMAEIYVTRYRFDTEAGNYQVSLLFRKTKARTTRNPDIDSEKSKQETVR